MKQGKRKSYELKYFWKDYLFISYSIIMYSTSKVYYNLINCDYTLAVLTRGQCLMNFKSVNIAKQEVIFKWAGHYFNFNMYTDWLGVCDTWTKCQKIRSWTVLLLLIFVLTCILIFFCVLCLIPWVREMVRRKRNKHINFNSSTQYWQPPISKSLKQTQNKCSKSNNQQSKEAKQRKKQKECKPMFYYLAEVV